MTKLIAAQELKCGDRFRMPGGHHTLLLTDISPITPHGLWAVCLETGRGMMVVKAEMVERLDEPPPRVTHDEVAVNGFEPKEKKKREWNLLGSPPLTPAELGILQVVADRVAVINQYTLLDNCKDDFLGKAKFEMFSPEDFIDMVNQLREWDLLEQSTHKRSGEPSLRLTYRVVQVEGLDISNLI